MTRYKIDLRSDIHTSPTPTMREATMAADIGGNALHNEDISVVELEGTAAAMFHKEAALFVPTATMGNIVSLLALTQPGDALIADPYTHIVSSEANGFERLARCRHIPIVSSGALTGDMVRECLRANNLTSQPQGIICVENTHSLRGGIPWGTDVLRSLIEVTHEYQLQLHVDGARIFNAVVATGETVAALTTGADTVQICLSKGLGAPCGSLVMGCQETIDRARQFRQMLGGSIHKPGMLAAAGLVALREMPACIADDHRRARYLATLLSALPHIRLAYPVQTNIIDLAFDPAVLDGHALVACAASHDLGLTGPWNAPWGGWIRLVTHYGITDTDIEEAAGVLTQIVQESKR